MHRPGKITASLTETRHYLVLLVHQLFTMYSSNDNTYAAVEAESGYRDALFTYLLSTTNNVIKTTFRELKEYLRTECGAMLTYERRKSRIYFSIEQNKNPA